MQLRLVETWAKAGVEAAKEVVEAEQGTETFSFGRMCAFSNEVMGQKTEGGSLVAGSRLRDLFSIGFDVLSEGFDAIVGCLEESSSSELHYGESDRIPKSLRQGGWKSCSPSSMTLVDSLLERNCWLGS